MSATGLDTFDTATQTAVVWLNELMEEMGWTTRHKAYHALRAVLHALRDRLPVNEAVDLAAELPMLIRGFYYEGWRPAGKPVKERTQDEFLVHVTEAFLFDPEAESKKIVQAVFKLLEKHISHGEIEDVKSCLPKGVRALWG